MAKNKPPLPPGMPLDIPKDQAAGVLAGLALVGVTVVAVGAISSLANRTGLQQDLRRELEWNRAEARRLSAHAAGAGWWVSAPAGWYDDGSGRMRWWDGQQWTAHYAPDPRPVGPPPGWYDDGSGRMRWWNGQQWTEHFQQTQHRSKPAQLTSKATTTHPSSHESLHQSRIRMSSAAWQERMRMLLLARAFSEKEWYLLSQAHIEDADSELAAWQSELQQLSPQQFSELINRELETNTAFSDEVNGL